MKSFCWKTLHCVRHVFAARVFDPVRLQTDNSGRRLYPPPPNHYTCEKHARSFKGSAAFLKDPPIRPTYGMITHALHAVFFFPGVRK